MLLSSSPVKDASLSRLRPGFKSRREHLAFSPSGAGSKREHQAYSSKPKSAKSGFDYVQFLNLVKEQSAELNFAS